MNNKKSYSMKNIALTTTLVTIMMLVFKLLGFIKQAVIAYYYGANSLSDGYFIAYGFISNIAEAIVQSINISIISLYSSLLLTEGKQKANDLVSSILEIMIPFAIILIGGLIICSSYISSLIAPSYTIDEQISVAKYINILSPLLLLSILELVFCGILDVYKKFFISRLQSLIYSITIIVLSIMFSDYLGIKALIYGQYLSSIFFIGLLILKVKKFYSFRFIKMSKMPEIKNVIKTIIPLLVGNGVLFINPIVDRAVATTLSEGAASALSYCNTLEQFVTNVMIVNIGNVIFAHFTEYVAKKRWESIYLVLKSSINIIICILVLVSIITALMCQDIVKLVYYRGSFGLKAVNLTSLALLGYSFSFPIIGIRDLLIKGSYAFSDTKSPMIASVFSVIINILLSIFLSQYYGIIGITLASSIATIFGALLNIYFFKKHISSYKFLNHLFVLIKCIPAATVIILFTLLLKHIIYLNTFIKLILICSFDILIYFFILYFSKIDEVYLIINVIMKKIPKRFTKKINEI